MKSYDVIVVGGGMVGASIACALADQHRHVAVIETRMPEPFQQEDPYELRVSAISRASQNLFQNLGAWEKIQSRRMVAYDRMVVWQEGGIGEVCFNAADIGEPDLGHIIENRMIQTALIDAMAERDDIDFLCPESVASIDYHEDQVVLGLGSGETLSAQLLIGADGARSFVRGQAGIGHSVVRDYDQKAIVCVVRTQHSHEYTAWQRFLSTGPLAFLPLPDLNHFSIVWSADTRRADEIMGLDDEQFMRAIGEAIEFRFGRVEWTSERAAFPLRGTQAEEYVRPRLALLGDAAHTIHPLAGQGVNLGLLDVAALAEVLKSVDDPGAFHQLRRYERMRRGDNTLVMHSMEAFKRLFGAKLPLLGEVRGMGLSMVNDSPWLKQKFMNQALGTTGDLPELVNAPRARP